MLNTVIKVTSVVGQTYVLIKIGVGFYKTTSPTELCIKIDKSLLEECAPSQIALVAKCLMFFTQCTITLASGSNLFAFGLTLGTLRQKIDD